MKLCNVLNIEMKQFFFLNDFKQLAKKFWLFQNSFRLKFGTLLDVQLKKYVS